MKWISLVLVLGLSMSAALADPYAVIQDATGTHAVQVHKEPFAVRHPKIHRKWRRFRRFCQVVNPIIPVLQLGAQVTGAVLR